MASVSVVPIAGPEAAAPVEDKMRVMVAMDDSDESFYALQWVLDIFFSHDDSIARNMLTIIHVTEPFPHYVFPGFQAVFPATSVIATANKVQEESASAILTHAVDMCTQRGVSFMTAVCVKAKSTIIEGDPKEIICDAAEQMNIDLVVIGSRGLGKIKRTLLGSVSDYVTHHAKCPVLVIKPPTDFKI